MPTGRESLHSNPKPNTEKLIYRLTIPCKVNHLTIDPRHIKTLEGDLENYKGSCSAHRYRLRGRDWPHHWPLILPLSVHGASWITLLNNPCSSSSANRSGNGEGCMYVKEWYTNDFYCLCPPRWETRVKSMEARRVMDDRGRLGWVSEWIALRRVGIWVHLHDENNRSTYSSPPHLLPVTSCKGVPVTYNSTPGLHRDSVSYSGISGKRSLICSVAHTWLEIPKPLIIGLYVHSRGALGGSQCGQLRE